MSLLRFLRRLLDAWDLPEASLEEIQARYRTAPPVTAWMLCPHCRTKVRGSHECQSTLRGLSKPAQRLQALWLAIAIEKQEEAEKSKKVLKMTTRRRTAA